MPDDKTPNNAIAVAFAGGAGIMLMLISIALYFADAPIDCMF